MSERKPPDSLRAIQRAMQNCVTSGDEDIRDHIIGTPKFSVDTRLEIYTTAYRLRLIDALSEAYPAVHTLLGDEGFYELAQSYINRYPSHYRSIRWFGDQLADFLAVTPPWSEADVIVEMARFEWTLRDAFDAEDFVPMQAEELQELPPESWAELQLVFNPTLQEFCYFDWNTPQLWQAIDAESPPIPPECLEERETWMVWRKTDQRTWYRSLLVDEAWALDTMRRGGDFADVCDGLSEWLDEEHIAPRAAGFIQQWMQDELVVGLLSTNS
jgi:hypothetical protein